MNEIPKKFERQKQDGSEYRKLFETIEKYEKVSVGDFSRKPIIETMSDIESIDATLWEMVSIWYLSTGRYLRSKERSENRSLEEKTYFGDFVSHLEYFLNQSDEFKEKVLAENPELQEIYDRFKIGSFLHLKKLREQIEQRIQERAHDNPEKLKNFFHEIHSSELPLSDDMIDQLLGIPRRWEDAEKIQENDLEKMFGREQFTYQGTSYNIIREFVKELYLNKSDVLYDLGSGYGRVPFYASLVTDATCKGIEISPERIKKCDEVKETLGITNVEFIQGNILEQDYSDGNVFFLFNPFYRETLEKVGEKLKKLAQEKSIRIISLGMSTEYFARQDWLRNTAVQENAEPNGRYVFEPKKYAKFADLHIFESKGTL